MADAHNHHHDDPDPDAGSGRTYHFDSTASDTDRNIVSGTAGNDIIHAHTDGQVSNQIHLYGNMGNDTMYLDIGVGGARHIQHGHHVYGGVGADKLVLTDAAALRGTIVGRLDDFDPRTDQIWIGNQRLDLHNPQAIAGLDVKIVGYQGQQWLEIRNDDGGRALYALEGARHYREPVDGRPDEPHFLEWNHDLPDTLPSVSYVDPVNGLDPHLTNHYHPDHTLRPDWGNGQVERGTNDNDLIIGKRSDDIFEGGKGDDLIRSFFGDDTVHGGEGDDMIDGEKGFDLLYGDAGNDTLAGNTDADTLYGGAGDDVLYGGSENDHLDGGEGDDVLWGNGNDDLLLSGEGNDTLHGGSGNDTLTASGDSALADGGEGNDVFTIAKGTALTVADFDPAYDRLDISEHFEDADDLAEFCSARANPDNPDVSDMVIEIPGGGSIVLTGAGDMADHPARIVAGWEDLDPEDDDTPDTPDVPVTDPDDDDIPDEDDDSGDDDGGGDDMGMGLIAALLGGLLMLGSMGGGFGG